MGELIELGVYRRKEATKTVQRLNAISEIQQVSNGVYVSSAAFPSYDVLSSGDYLSAAQFANAGNRLRRDHEYGYGVMSSIALKMVQASAEFGPSSGETGVLSVNSYDDVYAWIQKFTQDPAYIQGGSRGRVLLDRHLVHSALLESEGVTPIKPVPVPVLNEGERQVVRQLFRQESHL